MKEIFSIAYCETCGRVFVGGFTPGEQLPCSHYGSFIMADEMVLAMRKTLWGKGVDRKTVKLIYRFGIAFFLKQHAKAINIAATAVLSIFGAAFNDPFCLGLGAASIFCTLFFEIDMPFGTMMRALAGRYCEAATFEKLERFIQGKAQTDESS